MAAARVREVQMAEIFDGAEPAPPSWLFGAKGPFGFAGKAAVIASEARQSRGRGNCRVRIERRQIGTDVWHPLDCFALLAMMTADAVAYCACPPRRRFEPSTGTFALSVVLCSLCPHGQHCAFRSPRRPHRPQPSTRQVWTDTAEGAGCLKRK